MLICSKLGAAKQVIGFVFKIHLFNVRMTMTEICCLMRNLLVLILNVYKSWIRLTIGKDSPNAPSKVKCKIQIRFNENISRNFEKIFSSAYMHKNELFYGESYKISRSFSSLLKSLYKAKWFRFNNVWYWKLFYANLLTKVDWWRVHHSMRDCVFTYINDFALVKTILLEVL